MAVSYFFSPSKKKLYTSANPHIPSDAVEITKDVWQAFDNAPSSKRMLSSVNGQPAWVQTPEQQSTPSMQAEAKTLKNDRVTVRCTSNPSLNGDYVVDQQTRNRILGICAAINAGFGLPGGASSIAWSDANGSSHRWTSDQFLAFANGVIGLVCSCNTVISGQSTTLPSTIIEIP